MGRKMIAGNSVMLGPTSIKDMSDVSNLNYDKPYTEFNYDVYAKDFKQSNFVGGKQGKNTINMKLSNDIKLLYTDYKGGAKSKLKQLNKTSKVMKGGQMFLTELREMRDVSNLDYHQQFQYNEMRPVFRMPRSNMLLGE
jgi:hypothetical protein